MACGRSLGLDKIAEIVGRVTSGRGIIRVKSKDVGTMQRRRVSGMRVAQGNNRDMKRLRAEAWTPMERRGHRVTEDTNDVKGGAWL